MRSPRRLWPQARRLTTPCARLSYWIPRVRNQLPGQWGPSAGRQSTEMIIMCDFGIVVRVSLSAAVVTGMLCAGAQASLPQGQYACQVITKDGGPGLVGVQVDTREE